MGRPTCRDHGPYANLFWREFHFADVGDALPGHRHQFDHAYYVARGSFDLHADGHVRRLHAGMGGCIRAQDEHVAAEPDSVWCCLFALRGLDGAVVSDRPTESERYDGFSTTRSLPPARPSAG